MITIDLVNLFLMIVIFFYLFEMICKSFFVKEPFFWGSDEEPRRRGRRRDNDDDDDDDDGFWDDEGLPSWVIIMIVLAILGVIGYVFIRSRKKKAEHMANTEAAAKKEAQVSGASKKGAMPKGF